MSVKKTGPNRQSSKLSSASRKRHSRAPQFLVDSLEARQLFAAAPTIGIYATLPNASETDVKKTGHGEFTVRRTGSTAKALTFSYYVYKATTATAGTDYYNTLTGTVTIRAGQTSAFFNLYPVDDQIDEPDELVVLAIRPITGYAVAKDRAVVTIHDNDEPAPANDWFDTSRHSRTALDVNVGSTARSNQPVERSINFTSILSSLGKSGSLVDNSIRVMEVSADGSTVLNDNVPFQFDKASGYNALSNASGNLAVLVSGNTAANVTRHYQVYFDTVGSFSAPSFTSLVTTTDNVMDQGFNSVRVETQVATYFYQKAEGGFSSIVDNNGNDWISWSTANAGAGEFRGMPNAGPAGFHPGNDHDVTTVIVSQGPLKTTLDATDSSGNKIRWEFFPTFVRATVIQMSLNYYFLYEGTPGGSIDGNDSVVTSDNSSHPLTDEWQDTDGIGSGNGEEWLYFRDSGVNRYLFMVHNLPDSIEDDYWTYDTDMTVFGFGRHTSMPDHNTTDQLLPAGSNLNDVFTFGLADGGGDFNTAAGQIKGAYKAVTVTLGAADSQ